MRASREKEAVGLAPIINRGKKNPSRIVQACYRNPANDTHTHTQHTDGGFDIPNIEKGLQNTCTVNCVCVSAHEQGIRREKM